MVYDSSLTYQFIYLLITSCNCNGSHQGEKLVYWYFLVFGLSPVFLFPQVGIIGGTGLDEPNILQNASSKEVTTPWGPVSSSCSIKYF